MKRRSSSVVAIGDRQISRVTAFTLIELMVVVGLIVLLVAGAGIALSGRGGEGVALSGAQGTLAGLVGSTRAEAALNQTTARLLVYALPPPTGDAGKYLRTLQIVREEPQGSSNWYAVGDPVTLPTPVCVVPTSPVPATHLNTGVTWNNTIATGPVSTLGTINSFNYFGRVGGVAKQFFGVQGGSGRVFTLDFDQTGAVVSATSTGAVKVALTTAVLATSSVPKFNNASAVRGLIVRKTGAVSLVNDATGF